PRPRPPGRRRSTGVPTYRAEGYQYERSAAFREGRCYHARPMSSPANRIRPRIIPAILTALGVTFLAAGVLSFTAPIGAVPLLSPSPRLETFREETGQQEIT